MAFLGLFKIKNGAFDYTKYGLKDNTFAIDVSNSIQSSKGVTFTQYPLLDGTTRIDSVSRAPGTLNFQGKVGDVFHSANNMLSTVQGTVNDTRTQLFVKLLEDLRDNAIVLDIITESKTFENYLIESVSFGMAQFGVIDVNFAMKEFIAFGSEITSINFEPEEFTEDARNDFYLYTLTMNNFTTDQEMFESIFNLLTDSDVAEPYMIKLGSSDFGFNPDVTINPLSVNKPTLTVDVTKSGLLNFTHKYERTYVPTIVTTKTPTAVYSTGSVVGNLKLKITLPTIDIGSLVKETEINVNNSYDWYGNGAFDYRPDIFVEEGKYEITAQLLEDDDPKKIITLKDLLLTPKYSEISSGINPVKYVSNSFENDLMISTTGNIINKQALSFIKKTSDPNVYQMERNLLGDSSLGYLYPVKYLKEYPPNYAFRNYTYKYVIGFIYFHPELTKKIQDLINNFNITPTNLLFGKTIKWW